MQDKSDRSSYFWLSHTATFINITLKDKEMIQGKFWIFIVFCSFLGVNAQDKPQLKHEAGRWEEDIRVFEDWDRKNAFPADAVLFVGSSSIRRWPTRECFKGFPVINRGFGGSQISEVNYFAERIVLFYEPRVIVFYAGDNDIAKGKSVQRVFEDYRKFVNIVHERLSGTRIVFISIKPSRSRWQLWPVMKEANMKIKDFCDSDNRLFYFDSATPLLNNNDEPNETLFSKDNLHLNSKGYEVWTRLLRPIIRQALKRDKNDQ